MYNIKKMVIALMTICFLCIPFGVFADEENDTESLGGKYEGNFIFSGHSEVDSINDAIEIVKADFIEQEKIEKEQLEKEKAEKERAEKERLEKERLEKEKLEREKEKRQVQEKRNDISTSVNLTKEASSMVAYMRSKNYGLSKENAQRIYDSVMKYCKSYNVEPTLVFAIMEQESTFNPNTVYQGAYGLMQIYYTTFDYFGITMGEVMDIDKNIRTGVKEISGNIRTYGNYTTALSAYNWGSGNVNKGKYNTKYANSVLRRKSNIESYLRSR